MYEADDWFFNLGHMTNRKDWCVSTAKARSRTKTIYYRQWEVPGGRRSWECTAEVGK